MSPESPGGFFLHQKLCGKPEFHFLIGGMPHVFLQTSWLRVLVSGYANVLYRKKRVLEVKEKWAYNHLAY